MADNEKRTALPGPVLDERQNGFLTDITAAIFAYTVKHKINVLELVALLDMTKTTILTGLTIKTKEGNSNNADKSEQKTDGNDGN